MNRGIIIPVPIPSFWKKIYPVGSNLNTCILTPGYMYILTQTHYPRFSKLEYGNMVSPNMFFWQTRKTLMLLLIVIKYSVSILLALVAKDNWFDLAIMILTLWLMVNKERILIKITTYNSIEKIDHWNLNYNFIKHYEQNYLTKFKRRCQIASMAAPWHYGMVDSVPASIGRNAYYISHVSTVGRNIIFIWRIMEAIDNSEFQFKYNTIRWLNNKYNTQCNILLKHTSRTASS